MKRKGKRNCMITKAGGGKIKKDTENQPLKTVNYVSKQQNKKGIAQAPNLVWVKK